MMKLDKDGVPLLAQKLFYNWTVMVVEVLDCLGRWHYFCYSRCDTDLRINMGTRCLDDDQYVDFMAFLHRDTRWFTGDTRGAS